MLIVWKFYLKDCGPQRSVGAKLLKAKGHFDPLLRNASAFIFPSFKSFTNLFWREVRFPITFGFPVVAHPISIGSSRH